MRVTQSNWSRSRGWVPCRPTASAEPPQLVLMFGARELLGAGALLAELHAAYPDAHIAGCSTAGEIAGTQVLDDTVVVTTLHFGATQIQGACVAVDDITHSAATGAALVAQLPAEVPSQDGGRDPLVHVLVFSNGLQVNGSELVRGLVGALPRGVSATGGMAGDGARFGETLIISDGKLASRAVGVVGFYSSRLRVGYGCLGGWDSFGPDRLITRSAGNVLYELDGQSALGLYKKYLGDQAAGLPATGLLFPLSLRTHAGGDPVVRAILAVDEHEQSLTFAGDVPEGSYARLMKANFDRLIDGAVSAATIGHAAMRGANPEVAILISCVGRKLVLKQRIEEEVEGVRDVLGADTVLAGFYSYGEISPFTPGANCELHNQTMTITAFAEK